MNLIIISVLFVAILIIIHLIYSSRLAKLFKKIRNHRNLNKSELQKTATKMYSFNEVDTEIDALLEERLAEIDRRLLR